MFFVQNWIMVTVGSFWCRKIDSRGGNLDFSFLNRFLNVTDSVQKTVWNTRCRRRHASTIWRKRLKKQFPCRAAEVQDA